MTRVIKFGVGAALASVSALFALQTTGAIYYARNVGSLPPALIDPDSVARLELIDALRDEQGTLASPASEVERAARNALTATPLNPTALRLLAEVKATDVDASGDARLLEMSDRVSRRDLGTQLRLLQAAIAAEDVPKAMRHIDRALTTKPSSRTDIYRLMTPMFSLEQGVKELERLRDRPWFTGFISAAAREGDKPSSVARFLLSDTLDWGRYDAVNLQTLVRRLALSGEVDLAHSMVVGMGADIDALKNFTFAAGSTDRAYAPVTWSLYDQADGYAELIDDRRLEILVRPSQRIVAAERITALAPGSYTLRTAVGALEGDAPLVLWEVACLKNGKPERIASLRVPVAAGDDVATSTVAIPAACTTQLWNLTAQTDLARSPSVFKLSADLRRQ